MRRRQDGPLQRRRPEATLDQPTVRVAPHVLRHPRAESLGVLGAGGRERRVASNLAQDVILGLAVAREVDDVRRRVDRREELRDTHPQVAVHAVGDDLAAVVVELDVAQIVLRAVVLQRHVHPLVLLHAFVVVAHVRGRRLALVERAPLGADVGLDDLRLVHDDLDEDELRAERLVLPQRVRHVPPPLLGRARPPLLERYDRVCAEDDRDLARVYILAPRVVRVDQLGVLLAGLRLVHVAPRHLAHRPHERAQVRQQRVGVFVRPGGAFRVVVDVEPPHLRAVEKGQVGLETTGDERLAALRETNEAQHVAHAQCASGRGDRWRHGSRQRVVLRRLEQVRL
mmetsp:Transcript_29493/g.86208  ORF Transcript_29493/g.86208 Transcript_29493/m.86208 type:complete len:341 (-) Transcript_29493:166-1188(-)